MTSLTANRAWAPQTETERQDAHKYCPVYPLLEVVEICRVPMAHNCAHPRSSFCGICMGKNVSSCITANYGSVHKYIKNAPPNFNPCTHQSTFSKVPQLLVVSCQVVASSLGRWGLDVVVVGSPSAVLACLSCSRRLTQEARSMTLPVAAGP